MAEILSFGSFLPLFVAARQENHGAMELFGIVIVILVISVLTATISALPGDGRGHTPPVTSDEAWSALDLPSINHTLRNF